MTGCTPCDAYLKRLFNSLVNLFDKHYCVPTKKRQ
jgi:hypothetical protein